jgi:aryl-alcohol dehydrogenase-like predicted oxidoreductase
VHAALEHGVTFFDTGSSYARGQAEQRLGRALAGRSKHDLVIATKVGTHHSRLGTTYKDFGPAAVRASVEQSLRRLGLEAIPLLHLHAPRPAEITDELIGCLCELRDAGLIRWFGIHGASEGLHRSALERPAFSTAMFDYSILHANRRTRIRELVTSGRGFLAATPLGQSLWSSRILRPRRLADLWYLARALGKHRADLARGRRFRFIEQCEGWSGAQIALAYVLRNPDVSVAVFGTTSQPRLLENLSASGRALPSELIERIEAQI